MPFTGNKSGITVEDAMIEDKVTFLVIKILFTCDPADHKSKRKKDITISRYYLPDHTLDKHSTTISTPWCLTHQRLFTKGTPFKYLARRSWSILRKITLIETKIYRQKIIRCYFIRHEKLCLRCLTEKLSFSIYGMLCSYTSRSAIEISQSFSLDSRQNWV